MSYLKIDNEGLCSLEDVSPIATTDISEDIYKKILKRLSSKPIVEYKCHNCGASLELEEDKHIFMCKYCGSAYAVGTNMINDK